MDYMIWIGAILMGISLGLLGSGGSILTLPLLIFVAGEPTKLAIAESLLIVGTVASVGAVANYLKSNVDFKLVLHFGLPSMLAAYLGAWLSQFVTAQVQISIFGSLMILASYSMLKPKKVSLNSGASDVNLSVLLGSSLVVGTLAGLVGVGGGFLIVPALLLLTNASLKVAVGSSLVIIVLQSFSGFFKHYQLFQDSPLSFNWPLIFIVSGCAITGVLMGMQISERLPQQRIRQLFGVALILLAGFTFYKTLSPI
jgi:uncharacterized membrane protein YfcA